MRLTELNPRWVGISDTGGCVIGITFDSPRTGQRLGVMFTPAIDRDGWVVKLGDPTTNPHFFPNSKRWSRTGDTFEMLTLTPSLDFSEHGEWHGSITEGVVT